MEVERPRRWKTWLASLTGTVDRELLWHNEYLTTENRMRRSQIKGRLRLNDGDARPSGRSSSARIWWWVRSITEEWLARMILCGEAPLRHALTQDVQHLHHERHHQGKGNVLLFPAVSQDTASQGPMQCRERLERLLKYYTREAA